MSFTSPLLYDATCVDFGVVTHVCGGEGLSRKVGNPITELVATRRDEASLIAVKGTEDGKCRPTPVAMVRKVWWLYVISQEEGVPPLLIH